MARSRNRSPLPNRPHPPTAGRGAPRRNHRHLAEFDPIQATQPPAPWSAWLPVIILVVALHLLFLGRTRNAHNPNELSRLILNAALADAAAIQVDQPMAAYGQPQDLAVRDGRHYSDKAPGLSFISAPPAWLLRFILPADERGPYPDYWLLRHGLTVLTVLLPGVLLIFLTLRAYPAADPKARIACAGLLALATPWFAYSTVYFGHVPGAVLSMAAYLLVLRPGRPEFTPSPALALSAGVLAGLAVFTEFAAAIYGAAILAGLLLRRSGWRSIGGFVLGGIIGVAPLLIYNHLAFGSPFETGYHFKTDVKHGAFHARGFFGVTLPTAERLWGVLGSARRGLFFYSPILLLFPIGLWRMATRCRRDVGPLLIAIVGYICFSAGFVDWRGGWCGACRHLVPIVPLLLLPLAEVFEAAAHRVALRFAFAALAGASLINTLLSVIVTPYFPERFAAPLMQVAWNSFMQRAAAPNLITELTGLPAWPAMLPIAALFLAAGLTLLIRAFPSPRRPVALLGTALAAMLLSIGMQQAAAPPSTRQDEHMRALVIQRNGDRDLAQRIRSDAGP